MIRVARSALVTAAILLVLPSNGTAQLTLGLKGGVNFTDLADLESELSSSSKNDFVGGVYLNIGDRWSFQPELLYSRRGVDLQEGGTTLGAFKQQFVEVPVLVHFRLLRGLLEPALYAGASVAFETDCQIEEVGGESDTCETLLGADTSSPLWAGIAGVSADLDVTVLVLGLDARYNYGFSTVADESDAKWRYFSLMAQVAIALGR